MLGRPNGPIRNGQNIARSSDDVQKGDWQTDHEGLTIVVLDKVFNRSMATDHGQLGFK